MTKKATAFNIVSDNYSSDSYEHLDPTYDAVAKNLFSNRKILALLLHLSIEEFSGVSIDDIVDRIGDVSQTDEVSPRNFISQLNSESKPIDKKTLYFDIKTWVQTEDKNDVLCYINFEMQQKDDPDNYSIEERGIYYCSRLISEQLGKITNNLNYSSLRKVYSIWIVSNAKYEKLKRYRIVDEEFNHKHKADLLELIIIRLDEDTKASNDLFKMLHQLLFNYNNVEVINWLKDFVKVDNDIKEGVDDMCNLSAGVYERGMQKGMQKGITKLIESLHNLGISKDVTIDQLMKQYNLEYDEAIKYVNSYYK